jgi:ketosteroid isomerase-like protein
MLSDTIMLITQLLRIVVPSNSRGAEHEAHLNVLVIIWTTGPDAGVCNRKFEDYKLFGNEALWSENYAMKKMLFGTVIIFLLAVLGFGQKAGAAGAAKQDPAKGVRDALERLTEGIRQVDAAKLMSVYDNSDRTLFFNHNGSVTMGWGQMKENRESSFAKTKNVTLETTGVRVELLSPTSAYVSFKWKQTQEHDGKLESASGRTTLIFKKIGRDWKVLHAHVSPDNPPAGRPVFDSERERIEKPEKPAPK